MGTPASNVWVRCDKHPSVLRTTRQGGPEWDSVSRRVSIIVNPERPDLRCDVVDDLRDVGNVTDAATLYKKIDTQDGDLLLTLLFFDDETAAAASGGMASGLVPDAPNADASADADDDAIAMEPVQTREEEVNGLEETKGCAVLDAGATIMCSSTVAAEEIQQQRLNREEPGMPTVTDSDRRFRFADGRVDAAQKVVEQPITSGLLAGKTIKMHLIDRAGNDTCPLLSIHDMRILRMATDHEDNKVMFKDNPDVWRGLPTTKKGLMMIPLTQEACERHNKKSSSSSTPPPPQPLPTAPKRKRNKKKEKVFAAEAQCGCECQ